MVRRTKAEAEATRQHILDAAERTFLERGVAASALQQVAAAAGVTCGAIYWHFKDKADLLQAVLQRVPQPWDEEDVDGVADDDALFLTRDADPLQAVARVAMGALLCFQASAHMQQVFRIACQLNGYGDGLGRFGAGGVGQVAAGIDRIQQQLVLAVQRKLLPHELPTQAAALGLFVMVDGLMREWAGATSLPLSIPPLSAPFNLLDTGSVTVSLYLQGLRGWRSPGALAPSVTRAPALYCDSCNCASLG